MHYLGIRSLRFSRTRFHTPSRYGDNGSFFGFNVAPKIQATPLCVNMRARGYNYHQKKKQVKLFKSFRRMKSFYDHASRGIVGRSMYDLREDLNEIAKRFEVDLFGVASVEDLNDAPQGHRPKDILPNAKSVIVLGMKMLDAQTDTLPINGNFFDGSPRQNLFKGHITFISQELDRAGYAIARFLEKEGFKAYHQMASTGGTDRRYLMGLLSLKHIAVHAGLGVLGYNSLLITPQYGPRVRLTALVTDAYLKANTVMNQNFCEKCDGPCISFCPVTALRKPNSQSLYEINKFACSQYLSTRPTCGICLKVCPIGSQRVR